LRNSYFLLQDFLFLLQHFLFLLPLRISFFLLQDGFPFYGQLGPGGVEMKVRDGCVEG